MASLLFYTIREGSTWCQPCGIYDCETLEGSLDIRATLTSAAALE